MLIFFICLIVYYLTELGSGSANLPKFTNQMLWPSGEYYELIAVFPSAILGFTFHHNLFPIFFNLKIRTYKNMMQICRISVFFSMCIYITIGIIGFLIFGHSQHPSILGDLMDIMDTQSLEYSFVFYLMIMVSIGFILTAIMSIPILFLGLRRNLLNTIIFCKKKFKSTNHRDSISAFRQRFNTMTSLNIHSKYQEFNDLNMSDFSDTSLNYAPNEDPNLFNHSSLISRDVNVQKYMEAKYFSEREKMIITVLLYLFLLTITILVDIISVVSFYLYVNRYLILQELLLGIV